MYFCERQSRILEILEKRKNASVHYLAETLYASEPTIRRDLSVLEREGRIKRTFGGAVLSNVIQGEIPLALRERENMKAKESIAGQAVRFIRDGQVIFLDASSTAFCLTRHLEAFSDLTVITNSPKTSMKLAELKIRSFCTGGLLLENSIAYIGTHAENFVQNFNADVFFFSCRGMTEDGVLTDSSMEESELRRAMMRQSKTKVFLCTGDKIGQKYMYNLCTVSQVDAVISDIPLPAALAARE